MKKYFHIQLNLGDSYIIELGYSLAQIMCELTGNFDAKPYCYFTTPSDYKDF